MIYTDEMYAREMNQHLTLCAIEDGIPVSRIGYSNRWTNAPGTRQTFNGSNFPQYQIKTAFNGWLEVNADGYVYVLSTDKKLCNRLDCFVTSFQLAALREAGLPESYCR